MVVKDERQAGIQVAATAEQVIGYRDVTILSGEEQSLGELLLWSGESGGGQQAVVILEKLTDPFQATGGSGPGQVDPGPVVPQ